MIPLQHRLRGLVDESQVRHIARVAPDELAPQLGRIVNMLLRDRARHITAEGTLFVKLTVPTDTFKAVLGELFETLDRGGVFAKWLNLDMGSGKTHLLALIVYLLDAYRELEEHLEEYRRLGLKREVVEKTALLAIDLRTPSAIVDTFLPFFAGSLEKASELDAASYVRQCMERGQLPEASELVRRLRRDTRLVVIIDELHHAILTYRNAEGERRLVRWAIDFTVQLVNYLRHHAKGFAVLIASARRDYERLLQLGVVDELRVASDNLISQVGRLEAVLETRWLSVGEARQIILRRLGAREDILHELFNKLIERVVKAESDIPQAQHLRTLIKAMAVYPRNAIELGHSKVTPASFEEGVLDALFP